MAGGDDVVDLTDEGGGDENVKAVLHCKDVKMGKEKQLGELSLCGRFLTFTPANGSSASTVKVDAKYVQSMQVSKAGSAKVLLRIIAPPSVPDVTLDLSAVLNGAAWRDSFKDALTKLVSKHQSAQSTQKPSAAPNPTPTTTTTAAKTTRVDADPLSAAAKTAGGGGGKGGGGGGGVVTATVRNLDAAEICSYLKEFPKLATLYRAQVPLKMTEQEFWRRFLLAKQVQESAGEGARKGGSKVLASLEADSPSLASDSNPPPQPKGGGHSNLDLTSLETASTLRPPPPNCWRGGGMRVARTVGRW